MATPAPTIRPGPPARRARLPLAALLLLALLAAALPAATPARAAGCVVTRAADGAAPGPAGSLRAALTDPGCDAITFALPGAGPWTIALAGPLPDIGRPLAVTGPGSAALTIQGNNTFPLLLVADRGTPGLVVALRGLTLTRGRAVSQHGGDLRITGGAVTLTDVALTNATAAAG